MKMPRLRSLTTYLVVGVYGALLGLSLTRTNSFPSEQGLLFAALGLALALSALILARSISARVMSALPPMEPHQFKGLKILFSGLLVAITGWLIAAFIHIDTGIRVAAVGIVIGFIGMGVHFVLGFKRNHG